MKRNIPTKKDYSYDRTTYNELVDIYRKYLREDGFSSKENHTYRVSFKEKIKYFIPQNWLPIVKRLYRSLRFIVWYIPQIIIILPLYYLFFIIFVIKSMLNSAFGKEINGIKEEWEAFEALFSKWGHYPMTFVTKFEESILFMEEGFDSPSMEIGCQRGEHSKIIFKDKKIDFALEYSPLLITTFLKDADTIFNKKICADSYAIPLLISCMNTIFLINAIDDFQRGAEGAIAEYARILKPHGKLFFSGFTRTFREDSFFSRIDGSGTIFKKIYKGIHNCLDKEDWEYLLHKYNLELEGSHILFPIESLCGRGRLRLLWNANLSIPLVLTMPFRYLLTLLF